MKHYFNITHIFYIIFIVASFLASCSGEEKKEKKEDNINGATLPKLTVTLTGEELKNLQIELVKLETKPIETKITLSGKVISLPNNQAQLNCPIQGMVNNVLVRQGDFVKKGQTIMILSSMQLIELQEAYLTSKSEKDLLDIKFKRQEELMRNNIGALADFQTIEAQRREAANKMRSISAKLGLLGINTSLLSDSANSVISEIVSIKAPITGYITKLPISIGKIITTQDLLAEIVNINELQAEIFVYDQNLDDIKEGQRISLNFVNHAFVPVTGTVAYISRQIDPITKAGTIYVNFVTPSNEMILPGMSVQGFVLSKSNQSTSLSVPNSAILQQEDAFYVFGTTNPNLSGEIKLTKYKIFVGNKNDDYSEISFPNQINSDIYVAKSNIAVLEAELNQ
jgi:RND family efflux transporter MFP subunit